VCIIDAEAYEEETLYQGEADERHHGHVPQDEQAQYRHRHECKNKVQDKLVVNHEKLLSEYKYTRKPEGRRVERGLVDDVTSLFESVNVAVRVDDIYQEEP